MKQLSSSGQQAVNDIARRHGFSPEAVASMLESVVNGNGSMAQFNHPEFSGTGQWMSGGMTMVSDMFNGQLKGRVDALCSELSRLVTSQPDLLRSGSFQSQHQGGQQQTSHGGDPCHDANASMNPSVSLFAAPAPGTLPDWWPSDLRWPNSTGAQNGVRYAYFAQARRLAIELNGSVTVYDTQDHQIGGFSQQQSYGGSVTFSSQHGLVDVTRLPVVSLASVNGVQHNTNAGGNSSDYFSPATPGGPDFQPEPLPTASVAQAPLPLQPRAGNSAAAGDADIFLMIEKLADLRSRAIISDEDFNTKKTELLARL